MCGCHRHEDTDVGQFKEAAESGWATGDAWPARRLGLTAGMGCRGWLSPCIRRVGRGLGFVPA